MAKKRSVYKMSRSSILFIAFIAIALFLIFYQFYVVRNNALSTQIAAKSTVYDTISAQGVFIRSEQTLSPVAGVVVQSVEDGGKVGTGDEVAKVFSDASSAQNYTKILQLQEKLNYYTDLQSQTLGEAADIESMDKAILENVEIIAHRKNNTTFDGMAAADMALNDVMTRRRLLTGETIDFTPIINRLESQITSLRSAGAQPQSTVTTTVSGNFALQTDGYESYFDYSAVGDYTAAQIETFVKETEQSKGSQGMGKMITNFDWYIACSVDSSAVSSVKAGDKVTVRVASNSSLELEAVIYAKNVDSAQSGTCALILQCKQMNQALSSLRNEKIEIRLHPYTGLRIDNRAIRTLDGQKGVYVLISNKVVFRKIEVLYSGDGFVIAKLDNSIKDNIQLYDSVIVEGRDLYDGKFIN